MNEIVYFVGQENAWTAIAAKAFAYACKCGVKHG